MSRSGPCGSVYVRQPLPLFRIIAHASTNAKTQHANARLEVETRARGTKQHLGKLEPISNIARRHERLEVGAAVVDRRTIVEARGEAFEEAHGDVSTKEGEPLEEKAARVLHSLGVATPVHEAKLDVVFEHVQAFSRGDIPVPAKGGRMQEQCSSADNITGGAASQIVRRIRHEM